MTYGNKSYYTIIMVLHVSHSKTCSCKNIHSHEIIISITISMVLFHAAHHQEPMFSNNVLGVEADPTGCVYS